MRPGERLAADYELLEAAARTAGLLPAQKLDELLKHWNPLRDGGDALALVVRLGMTVTSSPIRNESTCTGRDDVAEIEPHQGNAYDATLRAIVRCAAASML